MAVEIHIKHGDDAAAEKDFLTAISKYSEALRENPEAFLALVKRSAVHLKLKDYDSAKSDISKAFAVAENRGKRGDKALCHYKLALVNYAEKEFQGAVVNFKKAKELGSKEPALDIWTMKAERDLKKALEKENTELEKLKTEFTQTEKNEKSAEKPEASALSANTSATTAATTATSSAGAAGKSTSIDVINKIAPLKVKIREDWYQNTDSVTVTIYAKNVKDETVEFSSNAVAVSFPSAGNSEYSYNLDPLCGEIDPEASKYKVYGTKVEITLVKKEPGKWASLEGNAAPSTEALAYPSSAKKAVNWSNFNVKDEEEPEEFFSKLYKDVDDDTRRAMMKSYVESNGTVLTTNWSEAKEKTFETSPPEGMQAKKWGQ